MKGDRNQRDEDVSKIQQAPNIQFLVFYKFTDKDHSAKKRDEDDLESDVEVIGMLSQKMERESFWVTPSQQCENEIQGQLFDEMYDANMIRLQDMQEKAIKFMREEGFMNSSYDFKHFLQSQ